MMFWWLVFNPTIWESIKMIFIHWSNCLEQARHLRKWFTPATKRNARYSSHSLRGNRGGNRHDPVLWGWGGHWRRAPRDPQGLSAQMNPMFVDCQCSHSPQSPCCPVAAFSPRSFLSLDCLLPYVPLASAGCPEDLGLASPCELGWEKSPKALLLDFCSLDHQQSHLGGW